MTARTRYMPALLLAAVTFSAASVDSGIFVRFKLLEPPGTSYYVEIGGYIHVEPWGLPNVVWPAGADSDRTKGVGQRSVHRVV